MADIIQFRPKPSTKKITNSFQDTKYKLDTEDLVNTSYTIKGVPVDYPKDQNDYLIICKEFMEEKDYKLVLLGVLDSDYFEQLRPELKQVVACYYELGEKR